VGERLIVVGRVAEVRSVGLLVEGEGRERWTGNRIVWS